MFINMRIMLLHEFGWYCSLLIKLICFFYTGQLLEWHMIFYGTELPPQTSSFTPSPNKITTQKTGWTDVKSVDSSKINSDFRDHMSDISGCQKTTETCLGWCLILYILCTFYHNLALNSPTNNTRSSTSNAS